MPNHIPHHHPTKTDFGLGFHYTHWFLWLWVSPKTPSLLNTPHPTTPIEARLEPQVLALLPHPDPHRAPLAVAPQLHSALPPLSLTPVTVKKVAFVQGTAITNHPLPASVSALANLHPHQARPPTRMGSDKATSTREPA